VRKHRRRVAAKKKEKAFKDKNIEIQRCITPVN